MVHIEFPEIRSKVMMIDKVQNDVSVLLHAYCIYGYGKVCEEGSQELSKVIRGKIDSEGNILIPSFNYDLPENAPDCSYWSAVNCNTSLAIEIHFVSKENGIEKKIQNYELSEINYDFSNTSHLNRHDYRINKGKVFLLEDLIFLKKKFEERFFPLIRLSSSNNEVIYYYTGLGQ